MSLGTESYDQVEPLLRPGLTGQFIKFSNIILSYYWICLRLKSPKNQEDRRVWVQELQTEHLGPNLVILKGEAQEEKMRSMN